MWVRTASGWVFMEVEYTQQGIPIPTKVTKGKCNF